MSKISVERESCLEKKWSKEVDVEGDTLVLCICPKESEVKGQTSLELEMLFDSYLDEKLKMKELERQLQTLYAKIDRYDVRSESVLHWLCS